MGILNKLFRGASNAGATQWDAILAECDLLMARDEILDMHRILREQAEREGGENFFKKEYVAAWELFRDNPNVDTARAFLSVAPMLRDYFEGCRPGGNFYLTNRYMKERGLK
jgi:hypothetical protein